MFEPPKVLKPLKNFYTVLLIWLLVIVMPLVVKVTGVYFISYIILSFILAIVVFRQLIEVASITWSLVLASVLFALSFGYVPLITIVPLYISAISAVREGRSWRNSPLLLILLFVNALVMLLAVLILWSITIILLPLMLAVVFAYIIWGQMVRRPQ